MTENMSGSSPTTKKRKANDGRATVPDSSGGLFSSWLGYFSGRRDGTTPTASSTCGGEKLTQEKIDTMMQMMSRMEKRQLVSMSSLERRCENLEAECSSLKTMVGSLKDHVDSKFDKQNEYNSMIVKNQSWKYSTPIHPAEYWERNGHTDGVATYLSDSSECLKRFTEKLRRGELPGYSDERKGIDLEWDEEEDPILDGRASDIMIPYWGEFAGALKQFTPAFGVIPGGCETYFTLENVQLPGGVLGLLKDALMEKPFQTLSFVNKAGVWANGAGMSIDSILDIANSNKHLRKLTIGNNRIQLDHMEKICSAVRRGSLVELDLRNCFENGLGDDIMTSLLINCGSKLQRLGLDSNRITSSTIALLANFLATNPPLKELDLEANLLLVDNDAEVLANALRSNTSLRSLQLAFNTIRDVGNEALRLVLYNDSSLNSIADSNHSCSVEGVRFHCWNVYGFRKNGAWHEAPESFNRARKFYNLLSKRNKSMSTSNVQYFDDIDVNLLPSILEAVQTYASVVPHAHDRHRPGYCRVEPLSIVYEVMRKWDKVFPLYTDGGDNYNGSCIE